MSRGERGGEPVSQPDSDRILTILDWPGLPKLQIIHFPAEHKHRPDNGPAVQD